MKQVMMFKVGDQLEIIDEIGDNNGELGDRVMVTEIDDRSEGQLIRGLLLTGVHKGRTCSRYYFRYVLAQEWDK